MKKKFASLLAGLLLFSLCSCGSAPTILESEEDCSDKMTVSDATVDSVYSFIESGLTTNPKDYTSSLSFHFTVKNDSDYICTSFSYTYNIADSSGKNVITKELSDYSGLLVLYPGDSTVISEMIKTTETYEFTTLETYKIVDFKFEKAVAYSSNAIYSTDTEETDERHITVSDLTVRLVNDLSGTNLYRVDYKMSYEYKNKGDKTIWLYYPRVVLHIDGQDIALSKNDISYAENSLQSFYYFNSAETLDLEKPYSLSIKAAIGTHDYTSYTDPLVAVVLTIMICSVLVPVVAGLIVLIVMLSINKKKKKKETNK